jgi:hypothetical protein
MKPKPPPHPNKRTAETLPAVPKPSSRPPRKAAEPQPETKEAYVLGVRMPVSKPEDRQ